MPGIFDRFRHTSAELRIDSENILPPDEHSGGVVRLTALLVPEQPLTIRCGRLELVLLTTRFSRTALDGYHEHTSACVRQTVILCKDAAVQPCAPKGYSAEVQLPKATAPDSRPVRMQWQAKATFEVEGHRDVTATLTFREMNPPQNGPPVIDGTGFLPLYEFRTNEKP
jgi:hypothetical protein